MFSSKDILKELVAIDSSCSKSNKEITEYIENKFKGFEMQKFRYMKGNIELFNLVVRIPGKSSTSPFIFVAHMDSVPATSAWKTNPFEPIIKDNKLYGLGSTDMKGGLACIMSAALNLDKKPENDVYLLFDADEEESGTGGRKLVEDISIKNGKVIVAEPTDKAIIYKQKGCLDILVKTFGKQMHSSKTDSKNNSSNNAVYKMIAIANALMEYEKESEKNVDSELGKATFNIGEFSGGSAANVVPGLCSMKISRRLVPSENIDSEFEKIKSIINSVDPSAKAEILFYGKTFGTDKDSEFAKNLISLSNKFLGSSRLDVQSGWTEAALFSKFGEPFIFGPGIKSNCHIPEEYTLISELSAFEKIYLSLMNSYGSN